MMSSKRSQFLNTFGLAAAAFGGPVTGGIGLGYAGIRLYLHAVYAPWKTWRKALAVTAGLLAAFGGVLLAEMPFRLNERAREAGIRRGIDDALFGAFVEDLSKIGVTRSVRQMHYVGWGDLYQQDLALTLSNINRRGDCAAFDLSIDGKTRSKRQVYCFNDRTNRFHPLEP